jgi:hypothetical protein
MTLRNILRRSDMDPLWLMLNLTPEDRGTD